MSEEIFDVVDQHDNVIDQKPRSEVHRLGLLHRATHLLVFNAKDEVLLQKRSMLKDNNPGLWDSSVSGHVDQGETYDACVVREAFEEIGVELKQTPELLFKLDACRETDWEFTCVYRTSHEGPFSIDEKEVVAVRWFGQEQVTEWIESRPEELAETFRYSWTHFQNK